ncbi:hypothetical protein QQP08_020557 [Theobroma cacao]|nr:hypothetical protein QQP08_020557 [Theobroma cacao]
MYRPIKGGKFMDNLYNLNTSNQGLVSEDGFAGQKQEHVPLYRSTKFKITAKGTSEKREVEKVEVFVSYIETINYT